MSLGIIGWCTERFRLEQSTVPDTCIKDWAVAWTLDNEVFEELQDISAPGVPDVYRAVANTVPSSLSGALLMSMGGQFSCSG